MTSEDARAHLRATTYSELWPMVDEYIDEALHQEGEEYFADLDYEDLRSDFRLYRTLAN